MDVVSNFNGVCQPKAEWRRRRLWKPSMYSKMAFASSTRVFQRFLFSSSVCIRPQNDSMTALSQGSPTVWLTSHHPARFRRRHRVVPVSRRSAHLSACRSESTPCTSPRCLADGCRVCVALGTCVARESSADPSCDHLTVIFKARVPQRPRSMMSLPGRGLAEPPA